jgi:ATP-dependent RNA helicase DeaD
MNQLKKLQKILDVIYNENLDEYEMLVKRLKKELPMFNGPKIIAAAVLKEYLGDISGLEIPKEKFYKQSDTGQVVFEDIKDGRARLFINIGKNHNISTGDLIREIVKKSGIDGKSIGKIDIHSTYSFFEIPEEYAELVLHSFEGSKIKGLNVVVEPAKKKKKEKEI